MKHELRIEELKKKMRKGLNWIDYSFPRPSSCCHPYNDKNGKVNYFSDITISERVTYWEGKLPESQRFYLDFSGGEKFSFASIEEGKEFAEKIFFEKELKKILES